MTFISFEGVQRCVFPLRLRWISFLDGYGTLTCCNCRCFWKNRSGDLEVFEVVMQVVFVAEAKLCNLKPSWFTFNPLVSFGLEVIRSHKTRHDVRSMPLKLIGASAFGCFLTPSSCRHIPRAHFPQPKIRIRIGRIGPIALWNPMVSKGARSGYGAPLFLLNCKLLGSRQKGLILIPYMVNQIHLESSPRCSPEVKSSHVEFWGPSHPVIQPSVGARLACRCRTPSLGSWRALKGWGWWTWRDHPRRDVSGL